MHERKKLLFFYLYADNAREYEQGPTEQANLSRDTKCADLDLNSTNTLDPSVVENIDLEIRRRGV